MKKILVAYDGSAGSELALKDMVLGGFPERAEAKILTVADVWLPPESVGGEGTVEESRLSAAHEKAMELLREARKTAINGAHLLHGIFPGWTVSNSAKADSPAWGIVAEAKRWDADLIVIGSHGRTPLERFFLGSVSSKVAAEAACSVRVVRAKTEHSHHRTKILIGIDDSRDARRAAEEVLARRWGMGTEAHLVTVIDPKLKSSILGREGEGALKRIEDWAEPLHRELCAKFAAQEIGAQSHILDGDPKNTILRHAEKWGVNCIFLGARGVDHGERLYLGTLASAICTRAHCTVEIVR